MAQQPTDSRERRHGYLQQCLWQCQCQCLQYTVSAKPKQYIWQASRTPAPDTGHITMYRAYFIYVIYSTQLQRFLLIRHSYVGKDTLCHTLTLSLSLMGQFTHSRPQEALVGLLFMSLSKGSWRVTKSFITFLFMCWLVACALFVCVYNNDINNNNVLLGP